MIRCPLEAMDRIHRLGQHRPVHAIKLVVEDSIEERIIQVRSLRCLTCMPSHGYWIVTVTGQEECHGRGYTLA